MLLTFTVIGTLQIQLLMITFGCFNVIFISWFYFSSFKATALSPLFVHIRNLLEIPRLLSIDMLILF